MVQNILIGIVSVFVAMYWTTQEVNEEEESSVQTDTEVKKRFKCKCPSPFTLYDRFPKFVLGYILLSLIFSFFVEPYNKVLAKQVYEYVRNINKLEFKFIKIFLCNGVCGNRIGK
jgi:hypothetical protein